MTAVAHHHAHTPVQALQPPPLPETGHLAETSGIYRSGGWLTIGLGATLADVAHSSLVRAEATCLAEAARFGQSRGENTLADGLRPGYAPVSGIALAVVALAAEIEVGQSQAHQTPSRSWLPVLTFLDTPLPPSSLPLSLRLKVGKGVRGSAFVPAPAVRGASASLVAAAASLTLAADGTISAAGIALLPQSGSLFEVTAASLLIGQAIDPDRIAAAAKQAQTVAQTRLGPTLASAAFPIQVAAHLVRKTLDRAAARCLAQAEI